MRSKHHLQSPKKPVYFLASVALHTLLVGLLIYFYSNFFHSKEQINTEETPAPPAPVIEEEVALARKDSALESISISPPPILPESDNDSVALFRSEPEQEFQVQENTSTPETKRFQESLESSPAAEEPAPALVSESPAQIETAPEQESAPPPAQPERGVIRAQFTTGIEQHEPIDRLGAVIPLKKDGIKRLYYFTEVKGMQGKTLIHRWELEDRVIAEVPLSIDSHQWRTYSSKDLTPTMTGRWQVVVTDGEGEPLHTDSFVYKGP